MDGQNRVLLALAPSCAPLIFIMTMYLKNLVRLDWKLLWDESELLSEEHPTIILRLVMSTLSTRKQWIEI
jgi:hypothetical protein